MKTINQEIIEYLKSGEWRWGGQIEDAIRAKVGSKASCVSRRLRELENTGKVEKRMMSIEENGRKFVQYRLKENKVYVLSGYTPQLQQKLI